MKGRKSAPTELKLLKGRTSHALPPNKAAPVPVGEIGNPPNWLSSKARRKWRTILGAMRHTGVYTAIDVDTLAAYCETATLLGELWAPSDRSLKAIVDCTNLMCRLAAELGLTPASRTKLAAKPKSAAATAPDLAAFISEQRA